MADRYAFQSPFSRGAGATPWFTLGSLPVTTSVFVSGLAIIGLFVLAIEGNAGPVGTRLILTDDALLGGQIWRLFTYPIAIVSSQQLFGQFLSAIFFYFIGTQMESQIGRRAFTWLVGIVTVLPAIVGSLVATLSDFGVFSTGLRVMFLGVAVAFAAANMKARSFFGIPFWVLVAVIFGLQVLGDLADGNAPSLAMIVTSAALGLVGIRSLGFAPDLTWAPSMPLPGSITDPSTPSQTRSSSPKKKRFGRKAKKNSGASHLQAVPQPSSASEAEIDALLDQVSEQGMGSLTKKQKQTLERHAKEMRKRRDS